MVFRLQCKQYCRVRASEHCQDFLTNRNQEVCTSGRKCKKRKYGINKVKLHVSMFYFCLKPFLTKLQADSEIPSVFNSGGLKLRPHQ